MPSIGFLGTFAIDFDEIATLVDDTHFYLFYHGRKKNNERMLVIELLAMKPVYLKCITIHMDHPPSSYSHFLISI
jgi:hypothetical protein